MSVTKLFSSLEAWDMTLIKQYCVEKGIYTKDEIEEAEQEYKKWLALAFSNLKRGQPISISATIDKFWHTHILFTQDYSSMCLALHGSYLHHRPSILDNDTELLTNYAEVTCNEYRKHFGEMGRMWDGVVCQCANNCCSDCVSASSKLGASADINFFRNTLSA